MYKMEINIKNTDDCVEGLTEFFKGLDYFLESKDGETLIYAPSPKVTNQFGMMFLAFQLQYGKIFMEKCFNWHMIKVDEESGEVVSYENILDVINKYNKRKSYASR